MTQVNSSQAAEYSEGLAAPAPQKEAAPAPKKEVVVKEEAKKAGEYLIKNSVKYRGDLYKKGETHTLDEATAAFFREHGFVE